MADKPIGKTDKRRVAEELAELPPACDRAECQRPLTHGWWDIYNQPQTGLPRRYCIPCGREIHEWSPTLHATLRDSDGSILADYVTGASGP